MPLMRVRRLDYSGSSPREVGAVLNTDHIINASPIESPGGRLMRVRFVDGTEMTCVGHPADFLAAEEDDGR